MLMARNESQTTTEDSDDIKGQTIIADANKIMRCLANGKKDRDKLMLETGLGPEDYGFAMQNLMVSNNPPWVSREGAFYSLTHEGRNNLPAPAIPEWQSEDVDPRKKNGGISPVHIKGKKGKQQVDVLGRATFTGGAGIVLNLIRDQSELGKGISMQEITDKTKLRKPDVLRFVADLMHLRQIYEEVVALPKTTKAGVTKVTKNKLFFAVNYVEEKKVVKEKPVKEKPVQASAPNTIPGTDIFVVEPKPMQTTAVQEPKATNGKTLDDELKTLMDRYTPTDIVLAVLAKMESKDKAQSELIRTLM